MEQLMQEGTENQLEAHPVDTAQRVILSELLDEYPAQLSAEELARVVGDANDTHDALTHLHRAGLVHRNDDYWWPTQAAVCFARLRIDT
jgi:predicted transcriptional regulator